MKIDEREIERLSRELTEKEYEGLFYGPQGATDFKTCIRDILNATNYQTPVADAFPIIVANYIEGDPNSKNYTVAIIKVEYDLIGGLTLDAKAAYRQRANVVDLLDASDALKSFADLPFKVEMMGLKYIPPTLINEEVDIQKQISKFQKQLADKGYDGTFYSALGKVGDFKAVLWDYMTTKVADKPIEHLFPIWLGTYTHGKPLDKEQTVCKLRVQFDPQKGFDIDRLLYSKGITATGEMVNENELKFSTIKKMPTKAEVNAKAKLTANNAKKKRMKF